MVDSPVTNPMRYTQWCNGTHGHVLLQNPEGGEWVSWADYSRLMHDIEAGSAEIERAQRIMRRAVSWLQIKEAAFSTHKGPAIIEEMQGFIAGSAVEPSDQPIVDLGKVEFKFGMHMDNCPCSSCAIFRASKAATRPRAYFETHERPHCPGCNCGVGKP